MMYETENNECGEGYHQMADGNCMEGAYHGYGVRDSPFDYFPEASEPLAALVLTIIYGLVLFAWYRNFGSWFKTLFWGTILVVPILSHLWHLMYGEASIVAYGGENLFSIFDSSTWENFGFVEEEGGLGIGGALWNSYEITVALTFTLYLVGAGYMIMKNGFSEVVSSPAYLALVIIGFSGIIGYGFIFDGTDSTLMYWVDLAALVAGAIALALFWSEKDAF